MNDKQGHDIQSSELALYFSQQAVERARSYHQLANMLVYPDDVIRRSFVEGSLREQCVLTAQESSDESLASYVFRAGDVEDISSEDRRFHELRVEYTRLFCQTPLVVSPYGADYAEYQGEELAVQRCYKQLGLVSRSDFRERADHIASEFDFLFYLAHAEALAWGQGDHEEAREWQNLERDFHSSHLGEFAASFSDALECATSVDYYVFVAHLIRAAIADPFFL
ncbi:MAG: molecular chaperone TorD family protein [Coriobacteriia bacterium]|nr:molecular chaperone TorD family protein [Coriobacteriia bacterium]